MHKTHTNRHLTLAVAARETAGAPEQGIDTRDVQIAHVLFLDLVGYSKLYLEDQARHVNDLTRVVIETREYRAATERHELITESTGDGMVLIFFGDPLQPVRCAIAIAETVKQHPHLVLRMGVHSGPVLRFTDARGGQGLVGAGVNMGQRVMDSATDNQILLSEFTAQILMGMSEWADWVQDCGIFEVKHGVRMRLFNLCKGAVGSRQQPRAKRPEAERSRSGWKPAVIAASVITAVTGFLTGVIR